MTGPRPWSQGSLTAMARLEVLPFASVEPELDALAAGTQVTVTCSPRHGIDHTLAFTETWAARGLQVVPHLAARLVEDAAHAARIAERVTGAGVTEVFVIGGDRTPPVGTYAGAAGLLADLAPRLRGVSIGVAGYPEGHPLIEPERLAAALEAKQRYATSIVTQLCFDPDRIVGFVRSLRDTGVTTPVLVGVAGAVDRRRLFELSLRIGVGASTGFLRKNRRAAAQLLTRHYDPGDLVTRLETHQRAEPTLGIAGLHVFTFNQLAASTAWLKATQREEDQR
jgi:methylenetetrahydrofolate reductase (NADPH)